LIKCILNRGRYSATVTVALLSEYVRIDPSNPRGNCREDERIPVAGIGVMTQTVYKLIEGWNAK
jgi:hypothetical protein